MEKNQVFLDLKNNIQSLETLENNIFMMELAIYQKSIENMKNLKIREIKEFFTQKSQEYGQKKETFEIEINENINKYKDEMDKLVKKYDDLYAVTFEVLGEAISNQNIAIANIVTLSNKLDNNKNANSEKKKIHNNMVALAVKKLNYFVIIEECRSRIKWCIENSQNDINEVFTNETYNLQLYKKENIFSKLKTLLFNKISGQSRFKQFLDNYENDYLKNIVEKNEAKISSVMKITAGVQKQMEDMKLQLKEKYDEMINVA